RGHGSRDLLRLDDAAHERPHHDEHDHDPEQHHYQELDTAHDVVLGELEHADNPARLADGDRRHLGEAQVDDLDLVAATLVETDGGAHQGTDAIEFAPRALLI